MPLTADGKEAKKGYRSFSYLLLLGQKRIAETNSAVLKNYLVCCPTGSGMYKITTR